EHVALSLWWRVQPTVGRARGCGLLQAASTARQAWDGGFAVIAVGETLSLALDAIHTVGRARGGRGGGFDSAVSAAQTARARLQVRLGEIGRASCREGV